MPLELRQAEFDDTRPLDRSIQVARGPLPSRRRDRDQDVVIRLTKLMSRA